ncbi:MAG: thioredoxin domain-containing protein [Verrucomicrobia bacterium]|nr:thioredoxin domain-containing protein [Verrucomicrobiota bacterium]MBS0636222.1 thioredoxin domain-containing protein [Verrucomicrobiota bacterium]
MENEQYEYTNRLINEKSPYLLQHAHNPVNWYPWGIEAFDAARISQKPIFLSIGYATCHWCHVMEQESFEDPEVAKALNDAFICIKVDREERPEIDSLYMEFAQTMIVGSAGWPLNVILTPELKPFFAATYLPKDSSRGLVGVLELTEKITELWTGDEQERILSQADRIVDILKSHVHVHGSELPSQAPIAQTADVLFHIADPIWGGMRGAPKFPLGYQANFLLRFYQRSQDSRAIFLVEKTLEMMHRGGINDHLGGGFHRYSVDEHWHVPHFEKMLYDNAILAYGYLEAWKVTHRPVYRDTCQEILDYVARDMQGPEGGFYSAQDADSGGVEGLFYSWTRDEVVGLLGEIDGSLFCDFYGVYDNGILDGRSVIHMISSLDEFCQNRGLDLEATRYSLNRSKQKLFVERERRLKPLRDDKVITSWNGLMIHAFIEAAVALHRQDYRDCAVKAARFIKKNLYENDQLMRRFREGDARFSASLDDYAFLIRALLSLFEAGEGVEWLQWAITLTDQVEELFKAEAGAFYQAAADSEFLVVRKTHFSDGAEPSGNAVHAENLLRLYQITGNARFRDEAEDIFKAVKRFMDSYPLGYCYHLIGLERYYDKKKQSVVIALNKNRDLEAEIKNALRTKHSPHHVIVWCVPGDKGEHVKPTQDDQTTLYLCHEGACQAPLTNKEEILKALQQL